MREATPPTVVVYTMRGFTNVHPSALELMASYEASDRTVFRTVRVPNALPFVLTAMKSCVVLALIGVIVTDPPEDRSVSFVGQAYRADEQTPVGCKALGAGPIPLHEGRGLLTICAHGVRADGEGCLAP